MRKRNKKKSQTIFLSYEQKINTAVTVLLLFSSAFVVAEIHQKNYIISSKNAIFNQLDQTASYEGNVTVSENKFTIRGETLKISYDKGRMKELFVRGLPLIYEEKPNRKVEKLSIKASQMQYQTEKNQIQFKGNVKLERNRDTVTADALKYDLETKEFSATGTDENKPVRLTINSLTK